MLAKDNEYWAIVVEKHGGPEVLVPQKKMLTLLEPGANQIQIQVMAAGVNPVETYKRAGIYANCPELPYTPGNECSGKVTKVGESVTRFEKGDAVYCYKTFSGAYAQYALVNESDADLLPRRISFDQGAAVGTAYRTAFRALVHKGKAIPGQRVLVHGATGGVGIATIQLAKAWGMNVWGTGGTRGGLELIEHQGCKFVANHNKRRYVEDIMNASKGLGVDLIIEMLANKNLNEDMKMLSKGGTIVVVGNRGEITVNPRLLMQKEGKIVGCLGWGTEEEQHQSRSAIYNGLRTSLSPCVGQKYSLKDASIAHMEIIDHKSGSRGKIIIQPWEEKTKS